MSAAGELLQAAKELLAKGKCVGAAARDENDNAVDPTSENATKFSIHGALTRAAYDRRDSTGMDAALLLLGASDLHDPRLDGYTKHAEDDAIAQRFDDAIARADGGPIPGVSLDAERRALDPNDPDYRKKLDRIEAGESVAADKTRGETPRAKRDQEKEKPGLISRLLGKHGAHKSDSE